MASAGTSASVVGVTAGRVIRTWVIAHNARLYSVQLSHETVFGARSLSVDGVDVPGTAGTSSALSSPATLVFNIDGKAGQVTIENKGGSFIYTCLFDGSSVVEENQKLNGSAVEDESINRLQVNVVAGDKGMDEGGSAVTWFRIHTVRESDGRENYVHRRFRDFYAINDTLRAAYKGSHLLSSFPSLPSRSFKIFEDHMSDAFIETRRRELQNWLFKVSHIPRMRTNPDFATFLGMIDNIRECSVIFPVGAALGLTLSPISGSSGEGAEVVAVRTLADGTQSPAQQSGLVQVGDRISKVNGDDCLTDAHDVIVAKLKAAARPMTVHFLGVFSSRQRGPDEMDSVAVSRPDPVPAAPAAAVVDTSSSTTATAVAAPPAAASRTAPSEVAEPITGLIGEGISYVGTGATPRPATMAARKGLQHHSQAGAGGAGATDAADVEGHESRYVNIL